MVLGKLLIAILATYRLAHLLPKDDGPLFVFTRIRTYISTKAMNENDELGLWANVDKWILCPYCQGLYAAILVLWLSEKKTKKASLLLLIFAIAGGQSLLQKWSEK